MLFSAVLSLLLVQQLGGENGAVASEDKQKVYLGAFVEYEADLAAFDIALDYQNLPGANRILPDNVELVGHYPAAHSRLANVTNSLEVSHQFCAMVSGDRAVTAVVGASTSDISLKLVDFTGALRIPLIGFSATTPHLGSTPHIPFIRVVPSDSAQSRAIFDLFELWNWERLALLTSTTVYGTDGLREFEREAFQNAYQIRSLWRVETDEDIDAAIATTFSLGIKVILIHAEEQLTSRILQKAVDADLTSDGHVFIVTDALTTSSTIPPLPGLLGFRAASRENTGPALAYLKERLGKEHVDVYERLVFDAVGQFASGLRRTLDQGVAVNPSGVDCSTGNKAVFRQGLVLQQNMVTAPNLYTSLDGVTMKFDSAGNPANVQFDIVNLQPSPVDGDDSLSWQKVGFYESPVGGQYSANSSTIFVNETNVYWVGRGFGERPSDRDNIVNGQHLQIVTLHEEPFMMYDEETGEFSGICKGMLDVLQHDYGFNFTYELFLVEDGNFGGVEIVDGESRWNGMVGTLIDGLGGGRRADMAVASLTINHERSKVISFTEPYIDLGLTILVKRGTTTPANHWGFFEPFTAELWGAIAGLIILYALCIAFVEHFSPQGRRQATDPDDKEAARSMNLPNAIWLASASFVALGVEPIPRSLAGRLLTIAYFFALLILSATFTANLAAFLVSTQDSDDISGLADLKTGKWAYATIGNSDPYSYFERSSDSTERAMVGKLRTVGSTDEGIQAVVDDRLDAFIWDSAVLDYQAVNVPLDPEEEGGQCLMQTAGRLFSHSGYGLALPRDSPFAEFFSQQVLRMRGDGRMLQLRNQYFSQGKCDPDLDVEISDTTPMGWDNMAGIFYIYFWTMAAAAVVLLLEILYFKFYPKGSRTPEEAEEDPIDAVIVPLKNNPVALSNRSGVGLLSAKGAEAEGDGMDNREENNGHIRLRGMSRFEKKSSVI